MAVLVCNLERRRITIHLVGAEKEADLLPLFEALLPFFPRAQLCIHMIGPNISPDIAPNHRAMLLKSISNDNSIFISLNRDIYGPQHYDASAFKLPDEFPEQMLKDQNFGQDPPDLIIALNAGLLHHEEWAGALRFLASAEATIYCTEPLEQMAVAVGMNAHMVGGRLMAPIQPNPFKQPIFDYKTNVNIPAWSNAFLFAFGN